MKRSLLSITFLLHFFSASQAQINLNDGLVGCYPFSGNANDMGPLANNGTVSEAQLAPDRFGNPNSAYAFDGINDHIEIGADNLQLNQFTYSIWAKPRRIPSYGEALFFFSIGSDYGDQHILFGDHYSNDRHTGLSHGSYLGIANNILCSESAVNDIDKWYHLVLVRNETDYILFVDNRIVCKNSHNGQSAFYGTSTVRAMIGARNNNGQHADAVIDDIHLYNRALNQDEITALFNGIEEIDASGTISADKTKPCADENVTLKVTANIDLFTVKWYVDGNLQTQFGDELTLKPALKSEDYALNIRAELEPDEMCFPQKNVVLEKVVEVTNCSQPSEERNALFVPDIFTPNNDGINDQWNFINAAAYGALELTVYNRWGTVIYHSENYSTPWDGTYKGARVLPGSYTYKVLSEKKFIRAGTVAILY